MTLLEQPQVITSGDMPDGIYQNVPDPIYRSWRRMSASVMDPAIKKNMSMKTLKASWDGLLGGSTPAQEFGIAGHCRLLEPDRFRKEFVVSQDCCSTVKKTGSKCPNAGIYEKNGLWFCGTHAPDDALKPSKFLTADMSLELSGMVKSVFSHPAVKLLRQHGGCEVSIAWTDETGVKCKGRLDKLIRDAPPDIIQAICPPDIDPTDEFIYDLKFVESAEKEDASNSINRYNWHTRGAFYSDGMTKLTGKRPGYVFVMIEKSYPYEIGVYWLRERSLKIGRTIYTSLLQRWAHALKTGVYPGINNDDIADIDIPEWKLKREEQHYE